MPDVSIIVVTWNSAAYIDACLSSIQTHSKKHTLEIIVADNGSTDDTCARIDAAFPDVILLRFGANLGFPRANNRAARQARGTYLFFLNPDTYLDNDAAGLLRARILEDPGIGIAGPGIVSRDGSSIAVDARTFPSLRGTFFRYTGLRFLFPHHPLFGGEYLPPEKRVVPQPVECLTGAAMMIESDFFHNLGGFDEQLPMYFEDVDLCGKVHTEGRDCGFVPSARIIHFGGESTVRSPNARFLHSLEDGQAPWMYFQKYRTARASHIFTFLLATGNIFRLALYLFFAPIGLLPRHRHNFFRRVSDSFILLQWCASNKTQCIKKAQSIFDQTPQDVPAEATPGTPSDE